MGTIKLIKPHKGGQRAVYLHPARFQVVICGRRHGKTELGKLIAAEHVLKGKHVAWVSPTNKMSTEIWEMFEKTFRPFASRVSVQERTIVLPNRGRITLWTAENGDSMRGRSFDLAILDEAAMYKKGKNLWEAVIRPALSDRRGRAYFMSTPQGRNWLYELYLMGIKDSGFYDETYKSWNFPTSYNPYIAKDEIEAAKKTITERMFRQEYLAEFLLDAGEVFRGVSDASINPYILDRYTSRFVMGIDFARKNDYTAISVMDVINGAQVDLVRFSNISFEEQEDRIEEVYHKWKPYLVYAEENSFGAPMIERLNLKGLDIEPFMTTNKSKRNIIEQLAIDIEHGNISLLNDRDQINELQSYTIETTRSGMITYNASFGHDDTVIALALANWARIDEQSVFSAPIPRMA